MRVAFALPMTTAGATDRGTANGIEKKGKGCDCHCKGHCCREGGGWEGGEEQGLHLPFVVVIIIIAVARMATSSLQLASRVCVSLKWNAGRRLLSGIIITTYVCTSTSTIMLCVVAITIRSRTVAGAEQKPGQPGPSAISHQALPLFSHCARRGAAWFGFVFCLLFFIPLLMLYATLCAGCTHFHMNAPQTWHTHRKGVASARCPGVGRGKEKWQKPQSVVKKYIFENGKDDGKYLLDSRIITNGERWPGNFPLWAAALSVGELPYSALST